MDYIAGLALKSYENCTEVFFSYDIACQWKVNLQDQIKKLSDRAWIQPDFILNFGVPKLHCKVHKYSCQCQFSMNLKKGLGQMDSEGIERMWDDINPYAPSTKEMGPGLGMILLMISSVGIIGERLHKLVEKIDS